MVGSSPSSDFLAVSGGFLEVNNNVVTILADTAEQVEEIDVDRAEEAIKQAQERISSRDADIDLERATQALRRSQARVRVGRRRRSRVDVNTPTSGVS